jgi:hypothetical protein
LLLFLDILAALHYFYQLFVYTWKINEGGLPEQTHTETQTINIKGHHSSLRVARK